MKIAFVSLTLVALFIFKMDKQDSISEVLHLNFVKNIYMKTRLKELEKNFLLMICMHCIKL